MCMMWLVLHVPLVWYRAESYGWRPGESGACPGGYEVKSSHYDI